jgi:pyruvate kinase
LQFVILYHSLYNSLVTTQMTKLTYPAETLKRTKIVATIGPASDSSEMLSKLVKNGMNVARLNFSHGTHEWHLRTAEKVREVSKKLKKPIAIMQDLQGPKFRIGSLLEEKIIIKKGQKITLFHGETQVDERIPVPMDMFPYLKEGDRILIQDGIIRLAVISVDKRKKEALCEVKVASPISSKKGMNIPDTKLPPMSLTDKDVNDLTITGKLNPDYVAFSFVQDVDDVIQLRKILSKHKNPPKIIVKLETKEAVKNLEALIKETDAIMVARGDLAVEIEPENVPLVQREVIRLARKYHTPVIIATQMLESMVNNPEPTRAEVNDVATAILDHVDAVMLSAESATGMYPVEAVAMQKRIIKRVERHRHEFLTDFTLETLEESTSQTTAIAGAASILAHQLKAALIVVETTSGKTASRVASYRPTTPIVAVTDEEKTSRQLALIWGIKSFYHETDTSIHTRSYILREIKRRGYVKTGDRIVYVTGQRPHAIGGTNSIKVETIV